MIAEIVPIERGPLCPVHRVELDFDGSTPERLYHEWFCPVEGCDYDTFDHGHLVD